MPAIAQLVAEAILHRDGTAYQLHAYVIMPNHVHLLVTPNQSVSKTIQSLKRHTAREANRLLGLTGQTFWQDESYDHLVRNATEFERITKYIDQNPVNAGLVTTPEDYRWSSAGASTTRPQSATPMSLTLR